MTVQNVCTVNFQSLLCVHSRILVAAASDFLPVYEGQLPVTPAMAEWHNLPASLLKPKQKFGFHTSLKFRVLLYEFVRPILMISEDENLLTVFWQQTFDLVQNVGP